MEYAVLRTGGKQYRISKGTVIEVDKLSDENKEITFSDVLLLVQDGSVKIGAPVLNEVKIKATIKENFKGEKIRVSKFKSKVRYRRVMGFRAQLSRLEIKDIMVEGKSQKSPTRATKLSKIKTKKTV